MHRISESMTKRLGQRKSIILNSPVISRLGKKELKNKKTNDLLVLFSKSDLSALPRGAKAIFEPFYCGAVLAPVEGCLTKMQNVDDVHDLAIRRDVILSLCEENEKRAMHWELWWFEHFLPSRDYSRSRDVPKDALAATNMFEPLSRETG